MPKNITGHGDRFINRSSTDDRFSDQAIFDIEQQNSELLNVAKGYIRKLCSRTLWIIDQVGQQDWTKCSALKLNRCQERSRSRRG
jgi:hypothetical protein